MSKTLLYNAKIRTGDKSRPLATAVLFGESIDLVGESEELLALCRDDVDSIDLEGAHVVPGFNDTHNHLSMVGLSMAGLDIGDVRSISDIQELISDYADGLEDGQWIITSPVGESRISHELVEARYPTLDELDIAAPHNPVCVRSFHVGILNSAAIRSLDLDDNIKSPAGGTIGKSNGRFDGRFYETAWTELIQPRLPQPSEDDLEDAIQRASARFSRLGLTGVSEHGANWEVWNAYARLANKGLLKVRSNIHLHVGPGSDVAGTLYENLQRVADLANKSRPGDICRMSGVKVFVDGGVALGTAYFNHSYCMASGELGHGILVTKQEELRTLTELCLSNEIQMSHHASGDGAIGIILDNYVKLGLHDEIAKRRFLLVHGQFPSAPQRRLMREFNVPVAAQTMFLYNMGNGYTKFQGDYGNYATPLRTLVDEGCRVGLGTDAPVNQILPHLAMWHATNRVCKIDRQVMGASETISREEALNLYTREAAYLDFSENRRGIIAPNYLADLAVFRSDPLLFGENESESSVQTIATFVGGRLMSGSLRR